MHEVSEFLAFELATTIDSNSSDWITFQRVYVDVILHGLARVRLLLEEVKMNDLGVIVRESNGPSRD